MADIFATMVVPAADAHLARSIASQFTTGSEIMWTTPLSATGQEPPTHFISTGYAPQEIPDEISNSIPTADVSAEPPFDVMARLGLSIINTTLEAR